MSVILMLLRVAFALVFIYAGYVKIADPAGFSRIVLNYHVLPEILVNPVAIALPWTEIICGLALLFKSLERGAAVVLNGLLVVFLAAFAYNLHRGLNVACGCFTTKPEEWGNPLLYLARDGSILLAGCIVMLDAFRRARAARRKGRLL